MKRRTLAVAALSCTFALGRAVFAQTAAPPPPPPPLPPPSAAPSAPAPTAPPPGYSQPPVYGPPPYGYEPPPPPPQPMGPRPGVREHDGFFLRMGLGFGGLNGSASSGNTASGQGAAIDGTVRGGGAMLELFMGGTPAPGLVLGGGLMGYSFSKPTIESGGQSRQLDNSQLGLSVVALFAQYYFVPTEGGYLQALVGATEETFRYDVNGQTVEDNTKDGVGLGLGGGWDFWVGEQWSLGPELRLLYANVRHVSGGVTSEHSPFVLSLAFTATLH